LIEVDARTGQSRNIIDEQTDTFIWTAHTENVGIPAVTWLEETDEIIYASEVDGWRHLYLLDPSVQSADSDAASGPQVTDGEKRLVAPGFKHQITKGEFVVRGVDRIDETKRQIWFRASDRNGNQDPYFIHCYRVNFDGTGLVQLTAGNGNHSIQFSPDRRFIIDTFSRVDSPPVHELRRVDNGKLVCKLEETDIAELRETGWEPAEVFVAKGRDGTTDIWGIICRPRDFDPKKKYPVIEEIYAGPQGSFVPKSFSSSSRYTSLTDLGFIVVKIDGMGTANRSKAFHDVCWHNLKDAGFPDRILWMKAAAAKYPQMDLSRVGVYGGSAGGQNAAGAVLFHGDFYKAAVAGCGCHDNRMDKASWNEQWMGYPVGPQYSECSNIDNAHRLQGRLMLIVGEMDRNVPPESTMRFADALIKADKDFDLIVVPGAGHGMGGRYGQRRMQDFFVQHLLGDKPAEATPKRLSSASNAETREPRVAKDHPAAEPAPPSEPSPALQTQNLDEPPAVHVPPESFFELVRERDRGAARQFYKKYIDVVGMPVVAAEEVADEALQRTYSIVTHMLAGRPDIVREMVDSGMYLIIIGKDQVYTDMPEIASLQDDKSIDVLARGLDYRPDTKLLVVNEENVLADPADPNVGCNQVIRVFANALHEVAGRRPVDPNWDNRARTVQQYELRVKRLDIRFDQELKELFARAMTAEKWRGTRAVHDHVAYWTAGVLAYLDAAGQDAAPKDAAHPVNTREAFARYDPELFAVVRETMAYEGHVDWRLEPAK
jgi:dienelactone hydrolase